MHRHFLGLALAAAVCFSGSSALGQIDPDHRQLIQLGYNQAIIGRGPIAGYAFYYYNQPGFLRTNMTLRVAVAPVYLDSELGFRNVLGEGTDVGIGLAGGGFANSYFEMRKGQYIREESFVGHGTEVSGSVYHLFNPGSRIPLSGVFRVTPKYSFYNTDNNTAPNFVLPDDRAGVNTRVGLRFGGTEPVMMPALGLEVSTWYENQWRQNPDVYGFGDREVESVVHLFWARTAFIYTLPDSRQTFSIGIVGGTSIEPDRFSAYRLGGDLPLSSEFPLIMPGYYFQEISAKSCVNFTAEYAVPLDPAKRWRLSAIGNVADVSYIGGLEQPGHVHSGAGLGIDYRSKSGVWNVMVGYGYGFEAIRSHGRGGQSIGFLCQIDIDARHHARLKLEEASPSQSTGLFRFLGRWF